MCLLNIKTAVVIILNIGLDIILTFLTECHLCTYLGSIIFHNFSVKISLVKQTKSLLRLKNAISLF